MVVGVIYLETGSYSVGLASADLASASQVPRLVVCYQAQLTIILRAHLGYSSSETS